jgi:hypothetical protein
MIYHPNASIAESYPKPKSAKKTNRAPFSQSIPVIDENTSCQSASAKPNKTELKEIGKYLFSNLNRECLDKLGKPFTEIIVNVSEAGITVKETPIEKKAKRREVKRGLKVVL